MDAEKRIEVVERWADPLWRLNNVYSCLSEDGKKVPFRPNSTQNRLINDLWYFNLVLKARQMGCTTFIDIMGLDQALFNDNWSTGICAHTREDVEKIFGKKVKFVYDELPLGLRTAKSADTDSAKALKFSNGSSIEVGTSLRSGTFQFVHVSEFGKICARYPEKAKEIVTGTFETVHPGSFLFVESTAEGRNGYFYLFVMEAQKRAQMGVRPNKLQFKLHFFPWYEDERNRLPAQSIHISERLIKYFNELEEKLGILISTEQRVWYATKEVVLLDDMKREHPSTVEEAFEVAIEGAYLAKQMALLRADRRITVVPHDPMYKVNTAWDFGISDRMCIWFHQKVGLQNRLIDYMTGTDDDVLYYWREMQKKPYIWGNHFMPHDVKARRIGTAKDGMSPPRTLEMILTEAGMKNIIPVPVTEDKYTAINESRLALPTYFIDESKCEDGIKCLDGFKREWDEKAGEWKNRPHHNWAMHGYDAFESLVRGLAVDSGDSTEIKNFSRPPERSAAWR